MDHNVLPFSLPQCRPHPKGDYYFIVSATDVMYHWMLCNLKTQNPVMMVWKTLPLTKTELDLAVRTGTMVSLFRELLPFPAQDVLFTPLDDDVIQSSPRRRHAERIPVIPVYCFCTNNRQRHTISMLFRAAQVVLFEVMSNVFELSEGYVPSGPVLSRPTATEWAAMTAARQCTKGNFLLLLGNGETICAWPSSSLSLLLPSSEHTMTAPTKLRLLKENDATQCNSFLQSQIQKWCHVPSSSSTLGDASTTLLATTSETHVPLPTVTTPTATPAESMMIIFAGSEAKLLLDVLKNGNSTANNDIVKIDPTGTTVSVEHPEQEDTIRTIPFQIHENIVFDGLNRLFSTAAASAATAPTVGAMDDATLHGQILLGCGVVKLFDNIPYTGYVCTVARLTMDEDSQPIVYGVLYEDGDSEDCLLEELLPNFQRYVSTYTRKRDMSPSLQRKVDQTKLVIGFLKGRFSKNKIEELMDQMWNQLPPVNNAKKQGRKRKNPSKS